MPIAAELPSFPSGALPPQRKGCRRVLLRKPACATRYHASCRAWRGSCCLCDND